MKTGIDLSKWNGVIDFTKVGHDNKVGFVLLREGYSYTIDSKFLEYAKQCLDRDIPVIGIYHFSYALNEAQAIKEADKAITNLRKANLDPDTIVFFDYEYDSVEYAKSQGYKPDKKTCTALTKAFCDRVAEYGYRPGVYYNVDFERNWYEDRFLENYARWVADWRTSANHEEAMLHQYSSKGIINGISGPVDMNYLHDVPMHDKYTPMIQRIASEVLAGKWGNGLARKIRLANAGYNYAAVQAAVNHLLGLD